MPTESRSVVVRLSVDTAQAIRSSQQFGTEFERAMDRADRSTGRVDQSLNKVGDTAGRAAAGAVLALGAMGKAAVDWESQFAGVEKTVDGTASQLAALEDELRELARTMPATHQEIAATAEAAGQLGVARKDVADFTETMIQLGETTNLTADQAATDIAQMANVLGTSQDDIDNVGAALVALGNDGASTEAQILGMAQRIAGAGAQIGLAESDILAIANAAASMGIEVEAGGSAISRVFTEMAKATAVGGEGLEQFADVAGISAQEFATSFSEDPARAFASFTQGLDRINKSGGDVFTTLDDLGLSDIRVSQALLGMAASGDLLTDSLDLGAEAFAENTALAEEYAKRADTTAAEVQVAWNNIKDAGIEAGAAILPVVSEVSDSVSSMAQAFGKLPDPVQSSVVELLALTAIIGGAAWFGTKVIGGVVSTREALADLAEISPRAANGLSRVGRTAVGISAVATAVGLLGEAVAQASGAKLDTSNLARDLEAIANGTGTEVISRVVDDLKITASATNKAADYLYETVAFFSPLSDKTGLDNAQDNIKAIDQELAGLVESGNADKARVIFESIVATLNGLPAGASVSQQAIDDVMSSFGGYETALGNAAAETEKAGGAAGDAAGATREYAGATGQAGEAAALTADQITELIDSMEKQREAALAAFDAETQWRQALVDAREAAAKNSAGIQGNSEAALENRALLSDLASAWNNQSDAVRNNEARFKAARAAFIETAKGMGVSEDAAKQLANRLLDLPDSKVIPVDAKTEDAEADVARLKGGLASIPDEYVNIWVTRREAGGSPGFGPQVESANGNILFFAKGDIANGHQPELYRGGTTRVWGEPETGGEAYIPLRNDGRRPRARAIATETVRLLGGTAHFADGGMRGPNFDRDRRSLENRGDILGLQRTIRDLARSLEKNGKDALTGLDRRIAQNDLAQARRDLRRARTEPAREARQERREERRDIRGALKDARRGFDIEGGMSQEDISKEFADFAKTLKQAGIDLPKGFDRMRDRALELAERFEDVTERIADTEQALEEWRNTAETIASSVKSIFNNNIYGLEGGGLANAMLQLEADRNDTAERDQLLQNVAGLADALGLDKSSEAFQSLATGADMQTLRDLDTAQEVADFFALFQSRLDVQNQAGQFAADAVTGTQIQALEDTLTKLNATQETLASQIEAQEAKLEAAATRGTTEGARAGVREGLRDEERVKTGKAKTR